jgi:hypothetical protein
MRCIIVRGIVGLAAIAVAQGSNELGMDRLTDRAILAVVGATDLDDTAFGKEVVVKKPKGFVIGEYKNPVAGGTGVKQVRKEKDLLWGAGQYDSPKRQPSLYSQGIKDRETKVYTPPVATPSLFSQGITTPKRKIGFKPPGQGYLPPKPSQGYSLDALPTQNKAQYWGVGGAPKKKSEELPAAATTADEDEVAAQA